MDSRTSNYNIFTLKIVSVFVNRSNSLQLTNESGATVILKGEHTSWKITSSVIKKYAENDYMLLCRRYSVTSWITRKGTLLLPLQIVKNNLFAFNLNGKIEICCYNSLGDRVHDENKVESNNINVIFSNLSTGTNGAIRFVSKSVYDAEVDSRKMCIDGGKVEY